MLCDWLELFNYQLATHAFSTTTAIVECHVLLSLLECDALSTSRIAMAFSLKQRHDSGMHQNQNAHHVIPQPLHMTTEGSAVSPDDGPISPPSQVLSLVQKLNSSTKWLITLAHALAVWTRPSVYLLHCRGIYCVGVLHGCAKENYQSGPAGRCPHHGPGNAQQPRSRELLCGIGLGWRVCASGGRGRHVLQSRQSRTSAGIVVCLHRSGTPGDLRIPFDGADIGGGQAGFGYGLPLASLGRNFLYAQSLLDASIGLDSISLWQCLIYW